MDAAVYFKISPVCIVTHTTTDDRNAGKEQYYFSSG
jgi:hypothetical protein